MRSSSGEHFVALDQMRAVAAFLVFTWHFTHGYLGFPVPFEYVPQVFLLAPFDEGHTGVALFMALSGYLFAKLLEGKNINYLAFLLNRFLRLAPLLFVVIVLAGIVHVSQGQELSSYAISVAKGAALPTLPNGGWSITVEVHFYLLLPVLLWLARKHRLLLLLALLAALALRCAIYVQFGEIHRLSYWTIVGRIDQFLAGMLAFHYRHFLQSRHFFALGIALMFALVYWQFDLLGGFYLFPSYPSPSPLWLVLPTIEGIAYGIMIAYYDVNFSPANKGVGRFVALMGTYSYSIYLLHFFLVFAAARFVHDHIMDISNFYLACAWAGVAFALMMPLGYLSFRFIEAPFLRLRRPYAQRNAVNVGSARAETIS